MRAGAQALTLPKPPPGGWRLATEPANKAMGVTLATVDPHESRLVPRRLTNKTQKRTAGGQQANGRGSLAAWPLAKLATKATAPPATSNLAQTLSGVEQFTHPCGTEK